MTFAMRPPRIQPAASSLNYVQRVLLLAVGLLMGIALARATARAGFDWWAIAAALGFMLATEAGIVQRCST